jgi:Right handed beta helix region
MVMMSGVAVAVATVAAPVQAASHRILEVEPGTGTISAAVAMARPGDTLRLEAGRFRDSVVIPFSLTVRGAGEGKTVIMPPRHPRSLCDRGGAVEGLCAVGAFDSHGNPDTSRPVTDVRISDLRVTGFSDSGVFGINTRGLVVRDVRADHNGGYGIARFVSTRTVFAGNWASFNGEAGLYMGDSPDADSVMRHNWADHNGFGLFLRDSTEITATGNRVWGNCVGILALNSGHGAPGDRPAGHYRIRGNAAWHNDAVCRANPEHPQVSGVGIALLGVRHTVVARNWVNANRPRAMSFISGGIVIASSKASGGTNPTNNVIRHNTLDRNKPADIVSDGTGTGNIITDNKCDTSLPRHSGFCHS